MKKSRKAVFKAYSQNQVMLLPPSLDELITASHPARIVNEVIEKIDLDPLVKRFKGGGTSSYHPKLLLKVLVYGYLNNIYSSRRIEAAVTENIHFMWLAGMAQPDHNTINRFRSDRLKGVLKDVFKQIVLLLAEAGVLDLKEQYVDGTKIEANANRFTFVWGNKIKSSKEKIKKQLDELWDYAQSLAAEELKDTRPSDFDSIDAEKVKDTIEKIDHALKGKPVNKKIKQKLNYAKKHWPENLKKYSQQEEILDGRNSYSKTDPDATFMRMKDDYMKNGQLKAGYNLQISTNNQIITNYSIHHNPADTNTLIPHLEEQKRLYGSAPKSVCADAGYGSEENYTYLQDNDVEAFVKYNYFHLEQTKAEKNPFRSENLYYNQQQDCYYCPMGQVMRKVEERKRKTENGYEQNYSIYEAQNCDGCPLRGVCHKAKGNRTIQINHRLQKLKDKARSKLTSPEGIAQRKKRPADVEAVFGNIKNNHGFKRFMLRGKEKVELEIGLIAISHNIRKMKIAA